MWIKQHSKIYKDTSNGLKQAIWGIWKNIDAYPEWHDDLELCRLEGDFVVGNYFKLKPKGGPTFKVFLTEIRENQSFTDCTNFFGAKMYDQHQLEETDEGLRITNTIKVTGPLAFLWVKFVAKDVAAHAPQEMERSVALAREIHV